ncbi:MAG: T9SS type A sorting domain-containing protein [Bacteroidota bacterium]
MKKIYFSLASLILCGSVVAQNPFQATKRTIPASHRVAMNPRTTSPNQAKTAGGPGHINGNFALVENIADVKSYTSGGEYSQYANAIFMDSTATVSDASGLSHVFNMKAGASFDPVSIYWGGGTQLLTANDPYTVDSLWIAGTYTRVQQTVVDTLLIEFTWAPPATSTVWQTLSLTSVTPAISLIAPKTNSASAHGNKTFLNVPAANYKRIKYALKDADTNQTTNSGYIVIPNVNQLVPAGNVFACAYTFVPGQTVAANAVVHQYAGGAAQTTNGFLAYLFSDPSTSSNQNFYDNTSKSCGYEYYTKQRYGMYTGGSAFLNNCLYPNLEGGWLMGFSVSYASSSVGINELTEKGFALNQNVPNPFNGQSEVTYTLAKEANSASFTVTDVMGRVISSQKAETAKGLHTVNLGNYSTGVYYYTLTVDGNSTTKKMIAQ